MRFGLRLWEIYNRRLLADTDPDERIITHYQAFFEDPEDELRKIAEFAGLNASATSAAASLIAVNRRHTAFTIEQMIDAGVSEEILALYRSLLDGTAQPRKGTKKSSRRSGVKGDQLAGAENKLNASVPNGEDVRRELASRRGDEIQHQEEVARYQKTIEGLREELAAKSVSAAAEINRRDGRIEELQKAYAHLDEMLERELGQRRQLLAELESARQQSARDGEEARQQSARDGEEITKLRERFTQTNQLLQKISIRLADFETRAASLTDRLRKQLLEMKRLLRLLDQIGEAAGLLRKSRRWKLANPFAASLAVFTGKPCRDSVISTRTLKSIAPGDRIIPKSLILKRRFRSFVRARLSQSRRFHQTGRQRPHSRRYQPGQLSLRSSFSRKSQSLSRSSTRVGLLWPVSLLSRSTRES